MNATVCEKEVRRLTAAGAETTESDVFQKRVLAAGEFLENTAGLTEEQICECLAEIDFAFPVIVAKLPRSVFVRSEDRQGIWFTDTGLSPEDEGFRGGRRLQPLYSPIGVVPALKSTARSIRGRWTRDQILQASPQQAARRMDQRTNGGGAQYIVGGKLRMRELPVSARR